MQALLHTPRPVAVRFDPLGARWRGRRERQVEDRNLLPASPASADRHDFVGVGEIDAFDGDTHAQNFRLEWQRQVLLQHRQEARSLLRLPIGVNDRLLNELF